MVSITSNGIPWLEKGTPGYNLFSDPPTQPPLPKYVLAGTATEDAAPQRRVASRGTEVFVAAGCEIRCVDLRDLKARYDEGQEGDVKIEKKTPSEAKPERSYQVLDIPELDFIIHQLEVSPDGNYLAIAGEKRVAVCMLPAPGFSRLSAEKLRAKYHQVGTAYHNDNTEMTVRIIWHPFGVDGASLVVLSTDAFVRVYDFTMHLEPTFEVPDQSFDLNALSGRETQRTSFIPDPESFEPASMCFASGDLSWRPFTLYILMRGGDIYALCPIVPSRWFPTESYLQHLQRELSAQLEFLEDSTVSRSDRFALIQQAKWLEDVLHQDSTRRGLNGRKKQDCYTRPELMGSSPKLQGPFLLQPPPIDMTAEEVYACDIIHIASDPVATISIVWSNANIDVFLEFEPLQARWVGKKARQKQLQDSKESPIISTFETIKLNTSVPPNHARASWPTFVENPIFSEVIFVAHYAGVEAVDMSGWLKNLKVVADPDEGEDFIVKQLQRTQGSIVKKVLNSGTKLLPQPMAGCVVLHDSYVGYILLANSEARVHSADFDIPFELREAGDIENTLLSVKPVRATQQAAGYVTSIMPPPQDPLKLLEEPSGLQIFAQAAISKFPQLIKGPLHYNAESLEVLRQAREQVKREYEKFSRVAEILYAQTNQQKNEYERQLLKVHDIITRQEAQAATDVKVKVTKVMKEQQALVARADAVMRLLIRKGLGGSGETAGMIKSEREREWESELEKIIKRTGIVITKEEGEEKSTGGDEDHGPKTGFEKRLQQVQEVFKDLMPLVEKISSDGATITSSNRNDGVPEELRKKKVAELKEMLEKESFLVNSTRSKLEKLEAKCEEMGL